MSPTLAPESTTVPPAPSGARRRLTGALFERAINPTVTRLLNATATTEAPLPDPPLLRPWVTGHRYGMSHYNVVIPDLPEPHRFLACMVLIGHSGTRVFDIDHAIQGSPRRTATVANGTAVNAADGFRAYSVDRNCDLREDGRLLRFGEDLEISGTFPEFRVKTRRPGLEIDLELRCTEQITWFARSSLYDHFGFPARYTGTISWEGEQQEIAGVCSLEYARAVSPQLVRDRPVPPRFKLPWDMFTYQVLALDPDTLLMLTYTTVAGRPLLTSAYVRQPDGEEGRWVHGVGYEPLAVYEEPLVAPDGHAMQVASRFRWTIPDGERGTTEIVATADTPMMYGLGTGWIGGTHFEGYHRGQAVQGRGYYEYADRRR